MSGVFKYSIQNILVHSIIIKKHAITLQARFASDSVIENFATDIWMFVRISASRSQ